MDTEGRITGLKELQMFPNSMRYFGLFRNTRSWQIASFKCEADGADNAEGKGGQEVDLGADQPEKGPAESRYRQDYIAHQVLPIIR